MDDAHYLYSFPIVLVDDPLCMPSSIRGTSLRREEYDYIFFVWIDSITQCDDVLLYHIVGLGIYRYDDDMFQIFGSS